MLLFIFKLVCVEKVIVVVIADPVIILILFIFFFWRRFFGCSWSGRTFHFIFGLAAIFLFVQFGDQIENLSLRYDIDVKISRLSFAQLFAELLDLGHCWFF